MNHLFRDLAPLSDAAWEEVEDEARSALTEFLTGRRLVDYSGPHGWEYAGVSTARVAPIEDAPDSPVQRRLRQLQPMVELRARFSLSRAQLADIDRGARDADLDPAREAARHLAMAEDRAIFGGYPEAHIAGITEATPHDPLVIDDDYEQYPATVATAVSRLREAGVGGPYAIALGPRCYTGVIETTRMGGYPVLEHLRLILTGEVIRAPAVSGAVVLSQRGGDFELVCGQDASIGYESHDADEVHLYLEESMTFRPIAPEAAVALVYAD